jgi:hypothetical protein
MSESETPSHWSQDVSSLTQSRTPKNHRWKLNRFAGDFKIPSAIGGFNFPNL